MHGQPPNGCGKPPMVLGSWTDNLLNALGSIPYVLPRLPVVLGHHPNGSSSLFMCFTQPSICFGQLSNCVWIGEIVFMCKGASIITFVYVGSPLGHKLLRFLKNIKPCPIIQQPSLLKSSNYTVLRFFFEMVAFPGLLKTQAGSVTRLARNIPGFLKTQAGLC